ncbi:MAG: OmpH family outer membrane protein, partial [Planctomycetota bacterium]
PQSDLYKKKQREFVKKKAEFVYLVKKYQQELKEKAAKYTKEIVADLEQAIEAYGKANGFHIIFRRYLPIKGSVELNFNTVVYHSKAIDITEDVIKTVNEIFSHKSKKKSGKGNGSQNKEKKNP